MKIYIDYLNCKNKSALSMAIKVFASRNPEIEIVLLRGKNESTPFEENYSNFSFIEDPQEFFKGEYVFSFVKPSNLEGFIALNTIKNLKGEKIYLTDTNDSSYTLEEKYDIITKIFPLSKKKKYALLTSQTHNEEQFTKFEENHKKDKDFYGIISPKDISSQPLSLLLTSPLVANIFIETLFATTNFFNEVYKEEKRKESVFKKMFNNFGGTKENIADANSLVEDSIYYIDDKQIIYFTKADQDYLNYLNAINALLLVFESHKNLN